MEAASRTWPGVSRYQIIGWSAIAPSNTEDELTSPACDIFEDSQDGTGQRLVGWVKRVRDQ